MSNTKNFKKIVWDIKLSLSESTIKDKPGNLIPIDSKFLQLESGIPENSTIVIYKQGKFSIKIKSTGKTIRSILQKIEKTFDTIITLDNVEIIPDIYFAIGEFKNKEDRMHLIRLFEDGNLKLRYLMYLKPLFNGFKKSNGEYVFTTKL
jgi:hypothetical protein